MGLAEEIKLEHRVLEIFDLAVSNLVVDCNVRAPGVSCLAAQTSMREAASVKVAQALKSAAK